MSSSHFKRSFFWGVERNRFSDNIATITDSGTDHWLSGSVFRSQVSVLMLAMSTPWHRFMSLAGEFSHSNDTLKIIACREQHKKLAALEMELAQHSRKILPQRTYTLEATLATQLNKPRVYIGCMKSGKVFSKVSLHRDAFSGSQALDWLKIHLANLYAGGVDELSYEAYINLSDALRSSPPETIISTHACPPGWRLAMAYNTMLPLEGTRSYFLPGGGLFQQPRVTSWMAVRESTLLLKMQWECDTCQGESEGSVFSVRGYFFERCFLLPWGGGSLAAAGKFFWAREGFFIEFSEGVADSEARRKVRIFWKVERYFLRILALAWEKNKREGGEKELEKGFCCCREGIEWKREF
ncbi:hypothetical protein CK203_028471 [Vitis vinifera]|uniref:Uncharacterized protein n=1 Tax=Vitis vinifera TaxID=29760 RepID=A0A438I271_VITVI|nr:hypothetical protein CK203_028471 [Vitis vinifera]